MKQLLREIIKITFITLVILFFVGAAYAWQEPGGDPSNSNVAAPINIGADSQTKSGYLTTGALFTKGLEINNGYSDGGGLVLDSANHRYGYFDNYYGTLRYVTQDSVGESVRMHIGNDGNMGLGNSVNNRLDIQTDINNNSSGIALNGRTAISAGSDWLRLNQDNSFDGTYTPNKIVADGGFSTIWTISPPANGIYSLGDVSVDGNINVNGKMVEGDVMRLESYSFIQAASGSLSYRNNWPGNIEVNSQDLSSWYLDSSKTISINVSGTVSATGNSYSGRCKLVAELNGITQQYNPTSSSYNKTFTFTNISGQMSKFRLLWDANNCSGNFNITGVNVYKWSGYVF